MSDIICPRCGVSNKEDGTNMCSCCHPIMAMNAINRLIQLIPDIIIILSISIIYYLTRGVNRSTTTT